MADEKIIRRDQTHLMNKFHAYLTHKLTRAKGDGADKAMCRYIELRKTQYDPKKRGAVCKGFTLLILVSQMLSFEKENQEKILAFKKRGEIKQELKNIPKENKKWVKDFHFFENIDHYFKRISLWDERAETLWNENAGNLANEPSLEQIFEQLIAWVSLFHNHAGISRERRQALTYRQIEVISEMKGVLKIKKPVGFSTFIERAEEMDFLIEALDEGVMVEIGMKEISFKENIFLGNYASYEIGHSVAAFKKGDTYYLADSNLKTIWYSTKDKEKFKEAVFKLADINKNKILGMTISVLTLVKKNDDIAYPENIERVKKIFHRQRIRELERMIRSKSGLYPKHIKDLLREWADFAFLSDDMETLFFCLGMMRKYVSQDAIKNWFLDENHKIMVEEILLWVIKEKREDTNKFFFELMNIIIQEDRHGYHTFSPLYRMLDDDGNTLLSLAAKHNNLQAFQCLLREDSGIRIINHYDQNPMHLAARYLSHDVMHVIAQNNMRFMVDQQDLEGFTPLMSLLKYNVNSADTERMAATLISLRPDIRLKDKHGKTALVLAMERGSHEIVNALLRVGAEARPSDLILAVNGGYINVVAQLISMGINPNVRMRGGKTTLSLALKHGDIRMAELLVKHHPLPDAYALYFAARAGNVEMVKRLLELGADMNVQGREEHTPLSIALENHKIDVAHILLAHKNIVPKPIDLEVAAEKGQTEIVKLLLAKGLKPDEKGAYIVPPFRLALWEGHKDTAELLIDGKVEFRPEDIISAAKSGSLVIVNKLLDGGVDPNEENIERQTALHMAAKYGHAELIQRLLEVGANPTLKDMLGKTPLDYAREKEHGNAIQILVEVTPSPLRAVSIFKAPLVPPVEVVSSSLQPASLQQIQGVVAS